MFKGIIMKRFGYFINIIFIIRMKIVKNLKKKLFRGLEFPKLCKDYKGEDYCGSPNSPVHFKNINCEKDITNLEECSKEMAIGDTDCAHDEDAIIECLNVDYNIK